VQLLAKLPGLGPRSARRAALHLIRKREELLAPLAEAMRVAHERIVVCSVCGNIDTSDPCTICRDARRDGSILVVVETVADLWALERAGLLNARYMCSAACCRRSAASARSLDRQPRRACGEETARSCSRNATVDGQTTAHYIADVLAPQA
jgi:recombination protein RecR